ncbi:MAG: C-GCAxxG-C-C family protein [Ignavibacteria bacterium]|nr:C-GCAxxG-C-C family protein [Ignavibacteria bacterium]
MSQTADRAIELFDNGYNCAQSVIGAFAENVGLEITTATRVAAGFGGGMGRMQETCGALTGSYMAIGFLEDSQAADNNELKEKASASVRELTAAFKEKFGSSHCKALVQCDLSTPEGHVYMKEQGIRDRVCVECIKFAVNFVEKSRE